MLQSDNFPGARRELLRAVQADPNLVEARLNLGMVEYQLGETAEAIVHLSRAAQLSPDSFDAHYGLALAYMRERKTSDGLRELVRARELNPRHPDAAYNLGIIRLGEGNATEAERLFRETRTLGADRPDVSYCIILSELDQRRFDDARRESTTGEKAFGEDAQWRTGVGRAFLEHGQPRDARSHLEEAFRLQPESVEIRRLLASARLEMHDAAGALDLLRAAAAAEDHYLRASALYALRRYGEARQEAQEALRASPREPKYLLLAARIAQRVGQHSNALDLLKRATNELPEWAEVYYSQGVSYYLLRRYEDARQSLTRAIKLDPQSSRALFLYAATLVNQGRNREGEDLLRRAVALEPFNARFRYHLGALLLRADRAHEAQTAFEDAIRLKPDFALPHYQLGKLLVRANRADSAAGELETAIRYQPDLAQAYYQLSRAYALQGKTAEATRALSEFNRLKKQETDHDQEFLEGIRKDLEAP